MTRTVCPNCGAPWRGWWESTPSCSSRDEPFLRHRMAACCNATEEYLAKLEASPTVALSVRLAEIEYSARKGNMTKPSDVMDIITELRRYMAFAEEVKGCTDRSMAKLEAALAPGGHQ